MADVIKLIRSSPRHKRSVTLGVFVGLASAILSLVQFLARYATEVTIGFAILLGVTLVMIRRAPTLNDDQEKLALSWLFGTTIGLVFGLTLALAPAPAPNAGAIQITDASPPCQRVITYGFKCTEGDFVTAVRGKNKEVVNLIVAGGIGSLTKFYGFDDNEAELFVDALFSSGRIKELFDDCSTEIDGAKVTAQTLVGCAQINSRQFGCALEARGLKDPAYDARIAALAQAKRDKALANYAAMKRGGYCEGATLSDPFAHKLVIASDFSPEHISQMAFHKCLSPYAEKHCAQDLIVSYCRSSVNQIMNISPSEYARKADDISDRAICTPSSN